MRSWDGRGHNWPNAEEVRRIDESMGSRPVSAVQVSRRLDIPVYRVRPALRALEYQGAVKHDRRADRWCRRRLE